MEPFVKIYKKGCDCVLTLKKTSEIVYELLKESVLARKDDNYLIKKVHEEILPGASNMTLNQILELITQKRLPGFETIRRSRQKLQEKFPELNDANTKIHRLDKQKEYRDFSRW